MSAKPNILGYFVLAGFAGAAVYAVTRKASGETLPPVEPVDCPLETTEDFARLEAWGVAKKLAVIYLVSSTEPPSPEQSLLARSWAQSTAEVVVVTNDGRFWSYKSGKAEPAVSHKADFCAFRS
jgi:hypothetical protein